jgi:histidinol dehydrogenase
MKRIVGLEAAIEYFGESRSRSRPDQMSDANGFFEQPLTPGEFASRVIAEVRLHGDLAVKRISEHIDGSPLAFIEVPGETVAAAPSMISSEDRDALQFALRRIRAFQESAAPQGWCDESGEIGEIVTPIDSLGAYVPAGRAPLASTVLMTVVPARVAGVREVVLCTPAPGDELPNVHVLAAAALAGVDRVFKIGGAQAIAAMAYGTETVPAVDKICGPGNLWVTAAKRAVYGDVGIDGIYGPTETLVVADSSASPELAAADLIAQAEHDVHAVPVLVSIGEGVADRIEVEIDRQLDAAGAPGTARQAINDNGVSVVVDTVEEAVDAANSFAPEHLCLLVESAQDYCGSVRSAGGIFIGEHSGEVLGDYVAGPSHVMPTGGTARFASALSVRDFVRVTPFLNLGEQTLLDIGPAAARLAGIEGLEGHAAAAELRLKRLVGE